MLGTEEVYIEKEDSRPLISTKVTNFIVDNAFQGTGTLSMDTVVYLKPSKDSSAIGTVLNGQQYNYINKNGDWHEINFLGRKAYIQDLN